jgi:hypothetical protein
VLLIIAVPFAREIFVMGNQGSKKLAKSCGKFEMESEEGKKCLPYYTIQQQIKFVFNIKNFVLQILL